MTNEASKQNLTSASLPSLLKESWAILCDRWVIWLAATVLVTMANVLAVLSIFALLIDWRGWNLLIAFVAVAITSSALRPGYLKLCLNMVTGRNVNLGVIFSEVTQCIPFLVATIVFLIGIALGSLLLILPGLFLLVRMSLYGFAMVDKKSGPIKALLESFNLTHHFVWPLSACYIIFVLGAIFVPITYLFEAFFVIFLALVYQKATSQEEQA